MIKILLFAAFLTMLMLATAGVHWVLRKLYFPLGKRHLQLRFVLVVLLLELVVFNYYLSAPLLTLLDRIINLSWMEAFLNFMLPNRSYQLIYMLLTVIGLNMLLLIGTVVLCLAVKLIFGERNLYFREDEDFTGWKMIFFLPHKVVCRFFDASGRHKSVLNGRGHCIGKWAGGMKWVFCGLGLAQLLTLAIAILWGSEDRNATVQSVAKAWYWLPMGGFLLADQLQAFLSDAIPSFAAVTVEAYQGAWTVNENMEQQQKAFTKTFCNSDALLCLKQLQKTDRDSADITTDPGNQQIADCANGELLSVLCERLKLSGEENQSEHYQRALAALIDGKHINVSDQLEGEFFIYLTAYLNFVLSQGHTAVLLCKSSQDAQRLKTVCLEHMYRLNNVGAIWSVCTAREANKDTPMNLLICSYDELLQLRLLEIRREFSSDLKCVIIAQGEQLFAQDHIRIMQLFYELQRYSTGVQYVLLSQTDNDSLRTAMEHYLGGGELLPFNNPVCQDNTCVMVWKEESHHKLQSCLCVGDDQSPYMGTALPLALVAAKWDVPKTYLIPGEDRPDQTYWQYMCSNTLDVEDYLSNHADVNAVIRQDPAEALKPLPMKQIICYDTQYDFLNVAWGWTKYAGTNGTILHIVSPHYLLREYFADRFMTGIQDQPVAALVCHSRVMNQSNMAAILAQLYHKGMTEEELLRRSKQYGWDHQKAEDVLEACLSATMQGERKNNIFACFCFEQRQRQLEEDGSLTTETFVTLTDHEVYDRVIGRARRAVAQIGLDQRIELPIPAADLTNYYLREQQLVLDGLSYKVSAIQDGTVFATQHNDRFAYEYFPISRFTFEDYRIVDRCVDSTCLDMNIATAKTKRKIYGYWKSNNGYRIEDGSIFTIENLSNCPIREQKTVNILEINLPTAMMGDAPRAVAVTLAFVLNGVFKTIFPHTHQNLFAVVRGGNAYENLQQIIDAGSENTREDIINSLIPFTHSNTTADADAQVVYIVEYSALEYGMVRQLYQNHDRVLRLVQEYLSWYLSEKTSGAEKTMSGRELHFGGNELPHVFAPEALLKLLEKITGEQIRPIEGVRRPVEIEMELSNTCAFCGREAVVMHRLDDGRKMCNACLDHQVTGRDEIRTMLEQTKRFLEKEYAIGLRQDIHVRFKSPEEIRDATDGVLKGRLLGVYHHGGNQLWVEHSGPRVPMRSTMVHELTRCWQYDNLPMAALRKALPAKQREQLLQQLLEGHAFLVEEQTMTLMHEDAYARRLVQLLTKHSEESGKGYCFLKNYLAEQNASGKAVNVMTVMEQLVRDLIEKRVSFQ